MISFERRQRFRTSPPHTHLQILPSDLSISFFTEFDTIPKHFSWADHFRKSHNFLFSSSDIVGGRLTVITFVTWKGCKTQIKQHETNPRPEKCNLSSQSGQRELKPLHLFKGTHVLLFMYKYFVQIFKGNEEGSYFIQSLLSWLVLIGVGFSAWTILMDAVLCKWWHLHGRELV